MLDKQGRLTIGADLLLKANFKPDIKVQIFFHRTKKVLLVLPEEEFACEEDWYYIQTIGIDKRGRIIMPSRIKNAFPDANYLPSEKNENIYIIIIEH